MRFLKKYWRAFRGSSAETEFPSIADEIEPTEPIARYIFSSSHYAATIGRVKPAAFMPPENLQTSVFRIQGLTDNEVWSLGFRHVATPGRPSLKARADFIAESVDDARLVLRFDNTPPRHTSIVGWPPSKDAQMSRAQVLAADSTLNLVPADTD